MLALNDAHLLPGSEIMGVHEDAATANENTGDSDFDSATRLIRPHGNLTLFMSPGETLYEERLDALET